jgi:hypothetical protein
MIIGQCVVGPGEADRWLDLTLKDFQRLCDDAVIVTCNATRKEIDLIKHYGFWTYEDNREWGKYQPDIKTTLLQRILRLNPDSILVLDADETVPTLDRVQLDSIATQKESAYFYVVNLWNDASHYSRSLSFWNVRLYNPKASSETQFLKKPVHCGNAPPYFYNKSAKESYVPHILLHRGLMLPADRARKVERYNHYDPNTVHKGRQYYDALAFTGTATEYHEEDVIKKLKEEIAKL